MAKQKGATKAQLEAVWNFETEVFSERERRGFRCADRLHESGEKIDEVFFAELRQHFGPAEIVELMAVAGAFEFFTRFVDGLRIPVTPQPSQ